jgi:hypothetical protein
VRQEGDPPNPAGVLLRACRERPRRRRAADKGNELAPVQSIEWHLLPQPGTS